MSEKYLHHGQRHLGRRGSCTRPHVWETFAIAILPADARTYDQNIVVANPAVRARMCWPAGS